MIYNTLQLLKGAGLTAGPFPLSPALVFATSATYNKARILYSWEHTVDHPHRNEYAPNGGNGGDITSCQKSRFIAHTKGRYPMHSLSAFIC